MFYGSHKYMVTTSLLLFSTWVQLSKFNCRKITLVCKIKQIVIMAIKFERMLIGDTFHCCHCYYWWRSLITSDKVNVSCLLPQNHEGRRKQPQTDSWHFRLILTRFSPGFIVNRVQIKLMYGHSIDCTNSIHVNVLVVFADGCSVLCCSSGSSWLEIPVDRWCIRCTNKLMTRQ